MINVRSFLMKINDKNFDMDKILTSIYANPLSLYFEWSFCILGTKQVGNWLYSDQEPSITAWFPVVKIVFPLNIPLKLEPKLTAYNEGGSKFLLLKYGQLFFRYLLLHPAQ